MKMKRKAQRIRGNHRQGNERKAERENCGSDQRGERERRMKGVRWEVRENAAKEMRGKLRENSGRDERGERVKAERKGKS